MGHSQPETYFILVSCAQSLRAQSTNSCRQHTSNWLYNKIQTDRQSLLVDSFPSHGEPPEMAIFTLSSYLMKQTTTFLMLTGGKYC